MIRLCYGRAGNNKSLNTYGLIVNLIPSMSHNIHGYNKYHICEHPNPGLFRFATIRQNLILNHCAYGVYSPQFAATAAPPMSKRLPDPRIVRPKIGILP